MSDHAREQQLLARAAGLSLALFIAVPSNAAPANWTNASTFAQALLLGYVLLKVNTTPNRGVGSLWALVAAFAVGGVYAGTPDAILDAIKLALTAIPIAMVVRRLDADGHRLLAKWVIALASIQAAIALSQKLFSAPVTWGWVGIPDVPVAGANPLWLEPAGRAMGSMGHAIPLGLLLGSAAILVTLSAEVERRLTQVALIALMFGGAMAAGTRSAIIVTTVVLAFTMFAYPNRLRNYWTIWAAAFVAVYIAFFVDLRQLTLVESLYGSASLTVRQSSWTFFGQLWTERPWIENLFGSGDIQALRRRQFFDPMFAIDNNFVTVFALAGVLGLGLLLAIIITALRCSTPIGVSLTLLSVGMFFAFDIVQWQFPLALLVVALYGFRKDAAIGSRSELLEEPRPQASRLPRRYIRR